MFISTLELFKIGIGPSSSHTLGPMIAARNFLQLVDNYLINCAITQPLYLRCTLKGSLAWTGKGHATDSAIILGFHNYTAHKLINIPIVELLKTLTKKHILENNISFIAEKHIIFDTTNPFVEHPNGMIFELVQQDKVLLSEIYFSIGGGFISTLDEITNLKALAKTSNHCYTYPFECADAMLEMAKTHNKTIAQMKLANELTCKTKEEVIQGIDDIWHIMQSSIEAGLQHEGVLPGSLKIKRRAKKLYQKIQTNSTSDNDFLCVYAMAVNEENAAGHIVVTAPTNGAAGVIPAVLYYLIKHKNINKNQIYDYFLTAAAIGGLIKHNSSISGAEIGCQGEVGSASAMAAAGACAVLGGNSKQIENAAEIALEHHLGMTCDPVAGLVQVPCIERNGFGAIKALSASSLALLDDGQHFVSLDKCIQAMKQTGLEMSEKFKETSLGGLAVSITEC